MVWQIRMSIENRLLLPTAICNPYWPNLKGGNYEYPTVLYWIGLATAAPEIVRRGIHDLGPAASITDKYSFLIRLRCVCVLVTSPLLVWVYLSAQKVVKRAGAAVFAAALVVGCWEFAYHTRFVTTDAIMTQFAGGTLLFCLAAIREKTSAGGRRRLIVAAIFAGLCSGTKYPGGMLAIPLIAAGWMSLSIDPAVPTETPGVFRRIKRITKLLALQSAVFLLTTPGAVLQPWNFGAWVWYDHMHYGVYGHGSHTIRNHFACLSAILQYLTLTMFSPSFAVSVSVAGLCLIGAVRLLWTDRRAATLLLIFPVAYVAYFTTQVADIVRNLLVLVPFLMVTAAVGVDAIFDGIRRLRGRTRVIADRTVSALLAGAIVFSLVWQIVADVSIVGHPHRNEHRYPKALDYIARHPELAVYPTESAARDLKLPIMPSNPRGTPVVIGFTHEDGHDEPWPSNIFRFARATFGVPEVNLEEYPDWFEDGILIVDIANARRAPSVQVERAVGRYDRSITAPSGFHLGPYLSAGGPPTANDDGISIRCRQSAISQMPFVPAASMPDGSWRWTDPDSVTFEIVGLKPDRAYTLGWSWWDETGGRRESVSVEPTTGPATVLQQSTTLPKWSANQPSTHWPPPAFGSGFVATTMTLPPAAYLDGRCSVTFRKDSGVDVTLSSIWIDRSP